MKKILIVLLLFLIGAFCIINKSESAVQPVQIFMYDANDWTQSDTAASVTTLTITKAAEASKSMILKGFIAGGSTAGTVDLYFGTSFVCRLRFLAGKSVGWSTVIRASENTLVKIVITCASGDCEGIIWGTKY